MRSAEEISAMRDTLEDDIIEHGWDASVDAASRALEWVLDNTPLDGEAQLRRYMERPDDERRREWIARGGDPKAWPIGPERLAGGEETTT
ncbi:hypothetical protein [Streptomyces sp. YIM S03343]